MNAIVDEADMVGFIVHFKIILAAVTRKDTYLIYLY